MQRRVTQIKRFSKEIDRLIRQRKLSPDDFASFKRELAEHPDSGDLIQGTGGVRKTRLKSASKGKSGGFRVCYFDDAGNEEIFLILIYPKNEQENINTEEKRLLKEFADAIKKR